MLPPTDPSEKVLEQAILIDPHTWILGKTKVVYIYPPGQGRTALRKQTDTCSCGARRHLRTIPPSTNQLYYEKNGITHPDYRIPGCHGEAPDAYVLKPTVKQPAHPAKQVSGHDWQLGAWVYTVVYHKDGTVKARVYLREAICANGCKCGRKDRWIPSPRKANRQSHGYRNPAGKSVPNCPPCIPVDA